MVEKPGQNREKMFKDHDGYMFAFGGPPMGYPSYPPPGYMMYPPEAYRVREEYGQKREVERQPIRK